MTDEQKCQWLETQRKRAQAALGPWYEVGVRGDCLCVRIAKRHVSHLRPSILVEMGQRLGRVGLMLDTEALVVDDADSAWEFVAPLAKTER